MQQSWKDHKISLDKPSIESGAMLHFSVIEIMSCVCITWIWP